MSFPTLRRGSTGADVSHLQRILGIGPVGNFGPKTEEAVKLFQVANGLTADGVVGPKTWAVLLSKAGDLELQLIRFAQSDKGTNGHILYNKERVCLTIELPWKNNQRRVSCIPDGVYPLSKRTSAKFGQHILLNDVPDRDLILIHPANDALKELNGCISPVSSHNRIGKGSSSKAAFAPLKNLVYDAIKQGRSVTLTISTKI